ncbi:hypothetical protein CEXT_320001 [Caerostris extrusa]|uniref:Uncharacterized protein n=1 Tax=Caerostris extrusa TaxID=172846 RepID=A0AAV4YDR6_CAEEX|nr:hypothetical protein CEXT_320001 [Caerostris extrusa]
MEITKCKYCNANVTNSEVHNCVKFGNQHRRTSATLPQCSSGNVSEDIGLITAQEMEDDALWPFVRQNCEETSAAEMYSWYDVSNQDQYNPANSDFHFPSKPYVEENEYKSVNLQHSSEPSQNSQLSDASNPGHPENIPTSLAQQGLLPGLQQTFDQKK